MAHDTDLRRIVDWALNVIKIKDGEIII